jgi:hypothetical protein
MPEGNIKSHWGSFTHRSCRIRHHCNCRTIFFVMCVPGDGIFLIFDVLCHFLDFCYDPLFVVWGRRVGCALTITFIKLYFSLKSFCLIDFFKGNTFTDPMTMTRPMTPTNTNPTLTRTNLNPVRAQSKLQINAITHHPHSPYLTDTPI